MVLILTLFFTCRRRSFLSYPLFLLLLLLLTDFAVNAVNGLMLVAIGVLATMGVVIGRGVLLIPFHWRAAQRGRRSNRYRYDGAVELQDPGGNLVLAVVEDISETGIAIAIETATAVGPDRNWHTGSKIDIVLRRKKKSEYIATEVMWFRDDEGMRRFGLRAADPARIQTLLTAAKDEAFSRGELRGLELMMDDPAMRWGAIVLWGAAALYLLVQVISY